MTRITLENINKKFRIGFAKNQGVLGRMIAIFSSREKKRELVVLEGLSLTVNAGEILGIIGQNGSGKSTLLRIIAGIFQADAGKIKLSGKVISLINLNIGLKERLTMKENIFLVGALFGLSYREIKKRFQGIMEFSELAEFVDTKIYQFSSGMVQRLIFSIAIFADPDILLLDEVFEVGDEDFRSKSANKIKDLVKNSQAAVILVSHDLEMVGKYCDRVILLEKGRIVRQGGAPEIVSEYRL